MPLETAVRLGPENARALRMLAALQRAGAGGAEALRTMQRLAKTGAMTSTDFLAYFSLALDEEEFGLARRLADEASKGGGSAMRHRLLARVAVRAGDPGLAERELRQAAAVDGTGRSRLELARVLVSRELAPATRLEVLEMLRAVSFRPDSNGAEALVLGLCNGLVPLVEVDGCDPRAGSAARGPGA
jgi:uncharacterized protein HemY